MFRLRRAAQHLLHTHVALCTRCIVTRLIRRGLLFMWSTSIAVQWDSAASGPVDRGINSIGFAMVAGCLLHQICQYEQCNVSE